MPLYVGLHKNLALSQGWGCTYRGHIISVDGGQIVMLYALRDNLCEKL